MAFRRRNLDLPRVELTPMIDVVFLLLIFFMISTTFIEQPGLTINLPESSAKQLDVSEKEVQVYLGKSGEIYFQQRLTTHEELRSSLLAYGEKASKLTFLLMADKDALHGHVIELMDLAKQTGFNSLAIATDKQTTEE